MNQKPNTVTDRAFVEDIVTVVDIGTTKIVALVGKRDEKGKVRILGIGKQPTPYNTVKRGVVLNIEQTSEMIKKAVSQAESQSGVKFTGAFVGIAGQHIKSRRESHSKVFSGEPRLIDQALLDDLREELKNLQLEPGHEIIHIIPQNYKVNDDSGISTPRGMYAKKIVGNYNVIEGETESVTNILKCFNRIGIEVVEMFLEPLASAEAVLSDEEREAGVALIDIGGGTTDIAVYYDKILKHTAVIPFGGNIITSDIHRECKILMRHAESVKTQFGSAIADFTNKSEVVIIPGISGRKAKEIEKSYLSGIIQARMEEILEFVKYELTNSGVFNQLGAGIVITGGGSMLKDLTQLVTFMTGQDVKLAYPGQNLSAANKEVNSPVYSTAVGLLMLGFQNLHKLHHTELVEETESAEEETQMKLETEETTDVKQEDMQRGIGGFFVRIKDKVNDMLTENDSGFTES